jgi:hypothetical protein
MIRCAIDGSSAGWLIFVALRAAARRFSSLSRARSPSYTTVEIEVGSSGMTFMVAPRFLFLEPGGRPLFFFTGISGINILI